MGTPGTHDTAGAVAGTGATTEASRGGLTAPVDAGSSPASMADVTPPLAGTRIVESAASLAATYAGFLLAELGADVVRIETPGARSTPGEHVLRRGKRSILLGDADASCREALGAATNVLLHDEDIPAGGASDGVVECVLTP